MQAILTNIVSDTVLPLNNKKAQVTQGLRVTAVRE